MTTAPRCATRLVMALSLSVALGLAPAALEAQSSPPAQPPADWGPISINLEGFSYPHPVEFLNLQNFGQDVRIAYMDVSPGGPANGRTVMLLHGGSYYGWYWKEQITALRNDGYRGVVKDRLGWGKSSKPILPYSMSLHASNTAALLEHLGIPRAAIVGHSIGGQMATRFAFLYPELTTHLVPVNQIGLTARRVHRPPSHPVRPKPQWRLAAAGLRALARWQPTFDGHRRGRLAPHPDEDVDHGWRGRRTQLSRERAARGGRAAQRRSLLDPWRRAQPT